MGLLDNVLEKTKVAVGLVSEKASQFVDVSRLNFNFSELKNKIKIQYQELGKLVYDASKNNIEEISEEIKKYVSKIDALHVEMEKLKDKIAIMKNKIVCKSCNFQNEYNATYCIKCGNKLEKPHISNTKPNELKANETVKKDISDTLYDQVPDNDVTISDDSGDVVTDINK